MDENATFVDTRPYFCSFDGCNMRFDRPSRLQWHIRRHTGERPFKCTFSNCDKAYATTTKLKRHQKTFHKLSIGNDVLNDLVSESVDVSKTEEEYTNPMEEMADVQRGDISLASLASSSLFSSRSSSMSELDTALYKYKCTEEGCDRSFKRRSNLYNHKVIQHQKRSAFSCPYESCAKSFPFPNLLRRHMKSHEGYKCGDCSVEFSKWTELRKHISDCHRKEHKCSQCSKTFKRPCDLRRHEITHSGQKQIYACPEAGCTKFYDRVSTLRKHIMHKHQGELPFMCEICSTSFPYQVSLQRHLKYHEKSKSQEKKKYPAKGHRKISLVERLIGTVAKEEEITIEPDNLLTDGATNSEKSNDYLAQGTTNTVETNNDLTYKS